MSGRQAAQGESPVIKRFALRQPNAKTSRRINGTIRIRIWYYHCIPLEMRTFELVGLEKINNLVALPFVLCWVMSRRW